MLQLIMDIARFMIFNVHMPKGNVNVDSGVIYLARRRREKLAQLHHQLCFSWVSSFFRARSHKRSNYYHPTRPQPTICALHLIKLIKERHKLTADKSPFVAQMRLSYPFNNDVLSSSRTLRCTFYCCRRCTLLMLMSKSYNGGDAWIGELSNGKTFFI